MSTEVAISAKEFGLEESQASQITSGLKTILEERALLADNYKEVIKLDITDAENMKVFRELRLKIANNRTKGINVWHKTNKEYFLTGGRFVDAIKNKEIAENTRMEEALMEGEKYFENLEKEKKEELNRERIEAVAPYLEDTIGLDLSGMEDDVFEAYLFTKKSKFEAALAEEKRLEEEKLEVERLDALEKQRAFEVAPFAQFYKVKVDLREMTDLEYKAYKKDLLEAKKAHDKAQEEIRLENERLKKEQEAAAEKRKSRNLILQPYIVFIRDYEKTLNLPDAEFEKEVKILKNEALEQIKFEAKEKKEKEELAAATAKKEAEFKAEQKRLADIQAKKDAAIQAELKKEREAAEQLRKEKLDAEIAELKRVEAEQLKARELAKAPVKEKLNLWVDSFELPATDVENETTRDIQKKFESFKKWAKSELENL